MRPGASAHDVHRAVSKGFAERGYHLGHVTGHSIGMTMIEFPKIGEGVETELAENMVFSMHPHAISEDGRECLYMQDTWLVTARRRRAARRPADADLRRLGADGRVAMTYARPVTDERYEQGLSAYASQFGIRPGAGPRLPRRAVRRALRPRGDQRGREAPGPTTASACATAA